MARSPFLRGMEKVDSQPGVFIFAALLWARCPDCFVSISIA